MELYFSSLGGKTAQTGGKNLKKRIISNAGLLLLSENASAQQVFKKEKARSLTEYIKKLNVSLGSAGTRRQAFSHLLILLPQLNEDAVVNNGSYWMKLCCQSLKSDDREVIISSLLVIRIILRHCHSNKELHNQVLKSNIDFLTLVLSLDLEFVEHSCDCLFDFLHLFSSKGLSFKPQIEAHIFSTLTLPLGERSREKVRSAGRVYALVPLPGGAGKVVEAQARGAQLKQLIALAHSAFDVLFANVQEIERYDLPREHKLPVTLLESSVALNEPIQSLLTASTLVSHVFDFMGAFLHKVPTIKINPKDLIRLPLRALQVESENFGGTFLEAKTCAFILPSIHLRAFRLLKDLVDINICGVFLSHVEEQVVSSLKSSLQKPSKNSSDSSIQVLPTATKILCYEILSSIVKNNRGCHRDTIEGVVPVILRDIVPIKDSVVLNTAVRGGRLSLISAKKKSKKKGYTVTKNNGPVDTQALSQMINQSVGITAAALKLAETLFLHASHVMSHKLVSSLSKQLITQLRNCRLGAYTKPEVRASLFSAVSAYALYPHPLCPPSYAFLCTAFKDGAQDPNPIVSGICEKSLSILSFVSANPSLTSHSDAVRLRTQNEPEAENQSSDEPHIPVLSEVDESENAANGKHPESEDDQSTTSIENDRENDNLAQSEINENVSADVSSDNEEITTETENVVTTEDENDGENVDIISTEKNESFDMSDCESVNQSITNVTTYHNDDDLLSDRENNAKKIVEKTKRSLKKNKKRKLPANKNTSRKKKIKDADDQVPGMLHLDEMLASFVDADPDPL